MDDMIHPGIHRRQVARVSLDVRKVFIVPLIGQASARQIDQRDMNIFLFQPGLLDDVPI